MKVSQKIKSLFSVKLKGLKLKPCRPVCCEAKPKKKYSKLNSGNPKKQILNSAEGSAGILQ